MHYIGLVTGLYNPIITIQDIPKEYHHDTIDDDDNHFWNSWYNLMIIDKLFDNEYR